MPAPGSMPCPATSTNARTICPPGPACWVLKSSATTTARTAPLDSYDYLLHQIAEKLDNDATRVTELFSDDTVFQSLKNLDTAGNSHAWFHFVRKSFDGYYLVQVPEGFLSYYQQGNEPCASTVRKFQTLQEAAQYHFQSIGPPFAAPAPILVPDVEIPARPHSGVWFAIAAAIFGACLAAMPRLRHALIWALIVAAVGLWTWLGFQYGTQTIKKRQ